MFSVNEVESKQDLDNYMLIYDVCSPQIWGQFINFNSLEDVR